MTIARKACRLNFIDFMKFLGSGAKFSASNGKNYAKMLLGTIKIGPAGPKSRNRYTCNGY